MHLQQKNMEKCSLNTLFYKQPVYKQLALEG